MSNTLALEYHPIANIFPLIEEEDLRNLADDIKQHGLVHPVLLFEGKILDGRNRYCACQVAGVEPEYEEFDGTPEEAISRVWSLNIPRRHLTSDQRACSDALRNSLQDSYRAQREAAKQRQMSGKGSDGSGGRGNKINPPVQIPEGLGRPPAETRELRAKAAGTNANYISLADKLLRQEPEVFMQVRNGERRLNQIRMERTVPRIQYRCGGGNGSKPVPLEPAAAPAPSNSQRRFQERHIGYVDTCIKEGRPLTVRDIAIITGLAENNIEKNSLIQYWSLIPWLTISPGPLYRFTENKYLRAVCDGRVPKPSVDAQEVVSSLAALRKEIDRRRKEAHAKRIERQWTPDAVRTLQLIELLNYIEAELDRMNTVTPSLTEATLEDVAY